MDKKKSLIALFLGVGLCFCCIIYSKKNSDKVEVITEGLCYCESVLEYDGGMLIANFGSSELNPLNNEGKGYVKFYKDGEMTDFIVADGNINAPKGMAVVGDRLYIADVNKVLVYDVANTAKTPHILQFPETEMFVNHLQQVGDIMLATVTNTGNIYCFDINKENMPVDTSLTVYVNVVGANGMLYEDSKLFVASYPADGNTVDENQIYRIDDMANPDPFAITAKAGHYDGLAMVDGVMYFTDWQEKALGKIKMNTQQMSIFVEDFTIDGPAEIDVVNGRIAVPDLVNSKVYLYTIEDK